MLAFCSGRLALRAVAGATTLLAISAVGACGARTTESNCGQDGPISFRRLDSGPGCGMGEEGGLFVVKSPADVEEFCHDDDGVDLAHDVLVGFQLEGNCVYSGCSSAATLIVEMVREGCEVVVTTRELEPGELGFCRACVQPGDLVAIDPADSRGTFVLD